MSFLIFLKQLYQLLSFFSMFTVGWILNYSCGNMKKGDYMADLLLVTLLVLLCAEAGSFHNNISVIASLPHWRIPAITLMIILSIYLYIRYLNILKKMDHQQAKILLLFSLVSMIIGMLVPYHKTGHAFSSSWHLLLTLSSIISAYLFQLIYLSELFLKNSQQFIKGCWLLLIGCCLAAVIIIRCDAISSLSEIIVLAELLLFVRINEK